MFQADKEGTRFGGTTRFSPTLPDGYDGFDVHNFNTCDGALKELVRELQEKERNLEPNEVNIVEFGCDDYCEALKLFASIGTIRHTNAKHYYRMDVF